MLKTYERNVYNNSFFFLIAYSMPRKYICTGAENIIATTKIRNNYSNIQLFKFQFLLCIASHIVIALSTIAKAVVVALSRS